MFSAIWLSFWAVQEYVYGLRRSLCSSFSPRTASVGAADAENVGSIVVNWPRIISVSAVGSLQNRYRPCDIVLPDQFLDRTKRSFEHTFFGRGLVAHVAFADPICEELRVLLLESASALKRRVHNGGTYVNMEGPAFSTRAESVANHKAGLDVIGMTNLGEAKCAREAEIGYVA